MAVVVECPAKVNLFLAVGPVDATGYHPIRTIFQAVALWDTLTVAVGKDHTTIDCDWPGLPADNTLTKALRFLGELVALPPLAIRLVKRIPSESGLGGGSSDAAGLLRGIVRLLGTPVAEGDLAAVAFAVGADVPFFLLGGRAAAEGYGERLTPMPDAPTRHIVIARPEASCPTARAYAALDRHVYGWRELPATEELHNDFERVAPKPCLELLSMMRGFDADGALLCGSGSAAFCIARDAAHASTIAQGLRAWGVHQVYETRTLTRAESLVARSQ